MYQPIFAHLWLGVCSARLRRRPKLGQGVGHPAAIEARALVPAEKILPSKPWARSMGHLEPLYTHDVPKTETKEGPRLLTPPKQGGRG